MYKIGEIAKLVGLGTETVRYYEQTGVLLAAERAQNGYRIYNGDHVKSLRFIKRCRELGFSLEKVRSLLTLSNNANMTCKSVKALADGHLQEVRRNIADLRAMEKSLAEMMVGRAVELTVHKTDAVPTDAVLEVKNLVVKDDLENIKVAGVSFTLRAGEVLGVAGVQGNGQTELVEALTGMRQVASGSIRISGQEVANATPRQVTELGVGHIPEDRQRDGLVLSYPVRDNMVLNTYYKKPFANGVVINETAVIEAAEARVKEYDVRTPSIYVPAATLSGGNQQKVIVAREFSRPNKLRVAYQPTRGLDVGSIEYIHQRIIQQRDAGTAILLVSTELDEIRALSDRVAVMFEGRIVAIVNGKEVSKEQLGLLMAGSMPDDLPPSAVVVA